jgi:hypothetical protein
VRSIAASVLVVGAALWLTVGGDAAPSASTGVSRSELALMPLPRAALGSQVATLPLAYDSGVVSNADAASTANETIAASKLAHLGRVTGYTLDYGSPGPAAPGVFDAQTTVELYRSAAAAASGLAFWRKDATTSGLPPGTHISTSIAACGGAALGGASFCDLETVRLGGTLPLYAVDIAFSTGDLVGQVNVSATSARLSRSLGAAAASGLERRIGQVLAGQIGGAPVVLPAKAKPGPPPGGPSLAAMALSPADLGSGTVESQGYEVGSSLDPVSEYDREMAPAGTLASVADEVLEFRTATQAHFEFALLSDVLASPQGWREEGGQAAGVESFVHATSAKLAAGDEARGLLGSATLGGGGSPFSLGFIFLRVGKTVEFMTFAAPAGDHLLPPAMSQLARLAATQAERGLHGTAHA